MKTGQLTKKIESMPGRIETRRNYIGASLIGDECSRKIWYEYKGYEGEPHSPLLLRTFAIGKRLEGLVLDLIKESGLNVINDDGTGSCMDSELPYFRGTYDALLFKPRAILEIKTAKDSSFKLFVKKGLKKWSPRYYSQLQAYMGMSEIYESYIVVINKDTSEIMDEHVLFDEPHYLGLRQKAALIAGASIPLPRISNSPLWFQCKQCQFNKICHTKDIENDRNQ